MWARSGTCQWLGIIFIGSAVGFIIASLYTGQLSYYASSSVLSSSLNGAKLLSVPRDASFYVSNTNQYNQAISTESTTHESNETAVDLSVVKVLCFVETCAKNKKRTEAIKKTWGKRCDKMLYISDENDAEIPTITLPGIIPKYEHLWSKTLVTFQHLYTKYLNQFDWFLKADDDTYIIVENLKYFLSRHNPDHSHYFGKRFKALGGYTSGGAGYVISRQALSRFGSAMEKKSIQCNPIESKPPEDAAFGNCLKLLDIIPGKSIDVEEKELFHSFNVNGELADSVPNWMYQYAYYPVKKGMDCCSNYTISFHYINPQEMKMIESMLYHLRVFGERSNGHLVMDNYYLKSHKVSTAVESKLKKKAPPSALNKDTFNSSLPKNETMTSLGTKLNTSLTTT